MEPCGKMLRLRTLLRHRKIFLGFLMIFGGMQFYSWATKEYRNAYSLNYFLEEKELGSLDYVVETPNCKILKMSPWEPAILPFIKPKNTPPNCPLQNPRHWTFLKGNRIYLNKTGILESGYSLQSIRCCYKGILRVEQTPEKYDWDADQKVKYTSECYPLGVETTLRFEFSRVFCTSTSWPLQGEIVFREFIAVAQPLKEESKRKIKFWTDNSKTTKSERKAKKIPPNVVMIGFDSLSRMNFHRSFNKTRRFLEKIGTVEFLGYTKIGENTHPNTAAFLSGYDHLDLGLGCMKSLDLPQDECPYIWKRFNKANYLTATVEDAPGLVGFNYLKLGFVRQPTDFYFRPFMLAVHKALPRKDYYHTDCIGRFTTEETLLNYISGILSLSSENSAPVFIHSWMTSLAHLDINGARYADDAVANFLSSLDLSNTILIFLSDHGQRYGAIRETLAGWYEDKLPIMSVYLPPSVREEKPEWMDALRENAVRLTSPYDLYKMMDHVLDEYTTVPRLQEISLKKSELNPNAQTLPRKGESLFTKISPQRRCTDAGIRINYCACLPPLKLNSTDERVLSSVAAAIEHLNKVTPEQCAPTVMESVSAAALMSHGSGEMQTLVVTFYTSPGHFLFEATVDFNPQGTYTLTTDLLRMNKISRDASCVKEPLMERYCYCS